MTTHFRPYQHETDFQRVGDFLITHFSLLDRGGNWMQPEWEYLIFHPLTDLASLAKNAVWEADGEMVGFVHYGWQLGEAFFQFHPQHRSLRGEMLDYAEACLSAPRGPGGEQHLSLYILEDDEPFLALARQRGYARAGREHDHPMSRLAVPEPFPPIHLPPGFSLTSLAEECDWQKVHQVLWRGFDHGDEVPMDEEELESRRKMFDTPTARRELKIAVRAPGGEFASFCGMFYEPVHRIAYVEPLATDPRYRRMGLGRAAVMEGIRRCAALGAVDAFVMSDEPFYRSLGFEVTYTTQCWDKDWD